MNYLIYGKETEEGFIYHGRPNVEWVRKPNEGGDVPEIQWFVVRLEGYRCPLGKLIVSPF
jgi:hypothetical protein